MKTKMGVDGKRLVVTFLGRLSRDKGLTEILRALDILAVRDTEQFTFLFAGDGLMRAQLLDEVKKYPVSYVRYVGPASNSEEVFRVLAATDIFVYPIAISNGYAMSFLEAMSVGVPGIISNVGPTPDLLVNGESALIIPRKDAMSLANAIELLIEDRDLCARISKNAAELVRRKFSVGAYREVIMQEITPPS